MNNITLIQLVERLITGKLSPSEFEELKKTVRKDQGKQFIVATENISTVVYGTSFNLYLKV